LTDGKPAKDVAAFLEHEEARSGLEDAEADCTQPVFNLPEDSLPGGRTNELNTEN